MISRGLGGGERGGGREDRDDFEPCSAGRGERSILLEGGLKLDNLTGRWVSGQGCQKELSVIWYRFPLEGLSLVGPRCLEHF